MQNRERVPQSFRAHKRDALGELVGGAKQRREREQLLETDESENGPETKSKSESKKVKR